MSEYDYDKLGQGQEVLATKKTKESTIAFLSQVPGKVKSTGYPLTIDFDGSNFMDGRNVMIYVPQQQICLPKDSVINNSVYVIDSRGRVHKQKIDGNFADGNKAFSRGKGLLPIRTNAWKIARGQIDMISKILVNSIGKEQLNC